MSISSVGKELLSNVVAKNVIESSVPNLDIDTNIIEATSKNFNLLTANNHLVPSLKLSSSTNTLFKNHPLQKQKIGHRRVDEHGQVTFKKIETSQICGSLQLGIRSSVGRSSTPERDVLMKDFLDIEITPFPSCGTNTTPAHKFDDFKFKTYAPNAFRYFRQLFGIPPDDYLMSVGHKQLRELSNPGASGSVFYKTMDDRFIIKTVQQKESHFLRKLLPKYFMNLHQNPDTLLPKFYGLYCYICGVQRVRVVVMNNLLPSKIRVDLKFDLKGSSYKRKASKLERNKPCPTLKDLDFVEFHENGIYLEPATYDSLIKTIKRDCTVLESFNIMDYSFLIGIHNFDYKNSSQSSSIDKNVITESSNDDKSNKENDNKSNEKNDDKSNEENDDKSNEENDDKSNEENDDKKEDKSINDFVLLSTDSIKIKIGDDNLDKISNKSNEKSIQKSTPIKSNSSFSNISILDQQIFINSSDQFGNSSGICTYLPPDVISGRTEDGKNILLFCGIIDILQSYEFNKRLEHSFKSIITDGKTISVTKPDYYATRFQTFLATQVFKKEKAFLSNKLEINPLSANNLSFLQRKINTPLLSPNFINLTNSQYYNHSSIGKSTATNTFDNQSTYSYRSSIRSAPPLNNFNKALQDELINRRNNLFLNKSITKGRLLSRHGYLESLGGSAYDEKSSNFGSSIFEESIGSNSYSNRAQIHRLSEQDEVDEKIPITRL